MKTMKRIAALMLALCMLIALPMAVGAEDTTPLTITAVGPNAWSADTNKENTKIKFTFSEAVNGDQTTITNNVFGAVGIYDGTLEGQYRYTWDDATGTCTKATRTDHTGQTGTTQWALSNFYGRVTGGLLGNLPSGWTINRIIAIYEKVLENYPNARLVGKVNDKSGAKNGYVDAIVATADTTKKLSAIDCSGLDWAEGTIVNSVKSVTAYQNGLVLEFTRTLPQANMGLTTTLGLYKDGVALTDGPTWTVDMAKAKFYGAGQKAVYVPFDQIDAVKTALAGNAGYSVGILMASTQTNANAGQENIITGVGGDIFSCNAMAGDKKAIYRKVTVVEAMADVELEMIDAKILGDKKVLIYFNQPVEFSNAQFVAVNILSGSSIVRWREYEGEYQLATGTKVGENGWQLSQWKINNLTYFGTSGSVLQGTCEKSLTEIQEIAKGVAGVEGQNTSNFKLNVRIQENANQGEFQNGLVDTVWAAGNENNKLIGLKEDGQTQTWHALDGSISGQAMIGSTTYESFAEALAKAESDDSVLLLNDVTAAMVKVPADVTLNLNGCDLTTDILVAFGDVIDSTEGNGKLVISKNSKEGIVQLQPDNTAMPLYDGNGYCFFSYTEGKLGYQKVTDAEENVVAVQYGIRFTFKNEKAYDLMAHADNAEQVIVKLEGVKGEQAQRFDYYLNSSLLQTYANAVKENTYKNPAIILTVSGISGFDSISGTPEFVSPTEMAYVGRTGTYTAE